MVVEEIRVDRENYANFPAGLRVLAVDDDPICLKLLETLLRKCQYHVNATSQARMALNMLRENKDRFDLVISDVHMPDMDGFKLLELVDLEMDLPVIMLSANSDPKLVMKGVSHGACDYLVKPVRIEELRNIWQHVLRRKNFESKNQNASSDQISSHQAGGGHLSPTMGNAEQNKFNRKRKDEEDESEDNGNDSEDPTTQKKPRVVWSIELHRKFVAAVNQLGIEKAVPKRILDMMNVEGLTRENVASHLQKYRLYLKRISHVTTQQANMAAALGANDSSFIRMGLLDGIGDFRTLAAPGRFANVSISSYATGGVLGRLSSPAKMSLHGLTPSTIISQTHAPNLSRSITSAGKTHSVLSSTCQNPSLFKGIPSLLEVDQLQPKSVINFNGIDNSRMLTTFNAFTDPGAMIGSSTGLLGSTANNNMMLFNSESFNSGLACSSNLLDPGKCDEMWKNSVESSKIQPNSTISTNPFHSQLSFNMRDNSSDAQNMTANMRDNSSDARNMIQTINPRWREQKQNYGISPNNSAFGPLNSQISAKGLPPLNGIQDQSNVMFNPKMDVFGNGRLNGGALNVMHQNENDRSALRSNDNNFLVEQTKLQSGFIHQGYDSFGDLMNAMIKREHDETMSNCDFGFDDYAFGQGI